MHRHWRQHCVKVVRAEGDHVKLGSEAPKEVSVQREVERGRLRLASAEVSEG